MISISTTIKTEKQAQAAMLDTLKNPPQTPMQAMQWLTKNVNFSSAFGKTIGGLIPGAGSVIGSLTEIFSAFSSAPSLGEMVMDGLSSLSNQIADLKNELTATIERTAEIQTQKTVDFVLQGIDEIQQEVSAVQIMQTIAEQTSLQELAASKMEVYTQYLQTLEAMQKQAYADIKGIIDNCEGELRALYESLILRFGSLGIDFFKYLEGLTAQQPQQTSRSAPVIQEAPGQTQGDQRTGGFNPLLLSPLLLLFFMKRKK